MPYDLLPVSDFNDLIFFSLLKRNDENQEISNNVLHLFGNQFLLALSVFSSSTSLLSRGYSVSSKGEIN